jgi:hypothetical protein
MHHKPILAGVACLLLSAEAYAVGGYAGKISGNGFNPALSLILDGRYSDLDADDPKIQGFQLGREAPGRLPEPGFSLGHQELVISANVDDKVYGFFSAGLEIEDGETEFEVEEAFAESIGLGSGFTLKGGQFYSGIGYYNEVHDHAQDFTDRPLVYDAMVGGHLTDVGVQARWTAPTPLFVQVGAEWLSGRGFPGGENEDGNSGGSLFLKLGGDVGPSNAWQAGAFYYRSGDFEERSGEGHAHGGGDEDAEEALENGEVEMYGLDFVWKWAPRGNSYRRNLTVQAEIFVRDEEGTVSFAEGANSFEADYDGEDQAGFYVQAVYQFVPRWRAGLRYDALESSNRFSNIQENGIDLDEFLAESSFASTHDPERYSVMFDYSPSEYSRFRIQYNRDESTAQADDQIYLQYLFSLGAHGAHRF